MLLCCLCMSSYAISFSPPSAKYIPIGSISQNHSSHYINLDLREKRISLFLDNRVMIFEQTVLGLDTMKRFPHSLAHQSLLHKVDDEHFYTLQIQGLQSVNNDTIYISAVLQKFNVRRGNVGRGIQINDLAIPKSELSGILVSQQPIREIRRSRRGFFAFVGGLSAVITTLYLIFGH